MLFFVAGCLTSVAIVAIIIIMRKRKLRLKKIINSQSGMYQILKHIIPSNSELRKGIPKQSTKYNESHIVKVIQAPDNKAYWVKDNKFYSVDTSDGEFDPTLAQPIDASKLSKSELKKLLLILDNLTDRKGLHDDRGSAGNE